MKTILFVDDELLILKAITRVFLDSPHRIICVESGNAALKIMEEQKIDLIVSDMRMPEMDGVELLRRVKQIYPDTIRLILSGYADEQVVIDILNNNIAKAYLFKPWKNDELIQFIESNLKADNPGISPEMLIYINNMDQLPMLKAQYHRIFNAIREEKDIQVIAAEIEKDQAISAKILQIVNSAYYGIKTGSIPMAVNFIGMNYLQTLITSMSIIDSLSIGGDGRSVAVNIWDHAFYTNKIQHILAHKIMNRKENQDQLTAGLLHNIGIVFMLKYYDDDYLKFLRDTLADPNLDLAEQEQLRYGTTHAKIAGFLLKWWNAPEPIIEAAKYHDNPLSEEIVAKDLVLSVHIAQHYACIELKIAPFCRFYPEAFTKIDVDQGYFEAIYQRYLK